MAFREKNNFGSSYRSRQPPQKSMHLTKFYWERGQWAKERYVFTPCREYIIATMFESFIYIIFCLPASACPIRIHLLYCTPPSPCRHDAPDHRARPRQARDGGILVYQHPTLGVSVHRSGIWIVWSYSMMKICEPSVMAQTAQAERDWRTCCTEYVTVVQWLVEDLRISQCVKG